MKQIRYALVTGGSRGIGRAVSVKLAQMGYHIIVNYVSNAAEAEKTLTLVREAGTDGELLPFDVSQKEQVDRALAEWHDKHADEYIEVLVNNAGITRDGVMMLMTEDNWHRVLETSLDGFYNVTQPLLIPMMAHKQGRVINMASVSGQKGQLGQVNYSAAKGGLIAATKALAQETARKGVTVNAVAPGFIETDMTAGLDAAQLKKLIPLGRLGKAEEVAELVGFLASPQAAYITGEVIAINGGMHM